MTQKFKCTNFADGIYASTRCVGDLFVAVIRTDNVVLDIGSQYATESAAFEAAEDALETAIDAFNEAISQ
jgi:hypothetical protein